MAFPAAPTNGQVHPEGGKTYVYVAAALAWRVQDQTGSGATNLTFTRDGTTVTVLSDTGTDAILPAATAALAGIFAAADKSKLDGITGTNTGDQTATTVPVTPGGNLGSANVQAALVELQGDIDALGTANAAENFIATAADPVAGDGVNGDYHLTLGGGNIGAITGPKAAGTWPAVGNLGNAFTVQLANAILSATLAGAGGAAATAARSDHRHAQSRGAALPATDGTGGIKHVLQGHATLPDGLWVLIADAGAVNRWVQA
jgi:hypothetical protein